MKKEFYKTRFKQVNIRFTIEEYLRVRALADNDMRKVSSYIRHILFEKIDEQK